MNFVVILFMSCHFQSLLAGGNFSLALLLMTITNVAAIFTVPPMLVWMTELSSGVNVARFGILMLVFFLGSVLPAIVSIPYITDSHRAGLIAVPLSLLLTPVHVFKFSLHHSVFHMTSLQHWWCPKRTKHRPCWGLKLIKWDLNCFLYVNTLFFFLNGC